MKTRSPAGRIGSWPGGRWASCRAVLVLACSSTPPPALATHERLVTIAARVCPTLRRDHRQPRAQQHPGEPARPRRRQPVRPGGSIPNLVDPESRPQFQPNCAPLTDWEFTLGGPTRRARSRGLFGSLSIVTTRLPHRHDEGAVAAARRPVGRHGPEIQGATTIELTDAEVSSNGQQRCGSRAAPAPSRSPIRTSTPSARCAARPTTSTATTSSGSPTRRAAPRVLLRLLRRAAPTAAIKIVKALTRPSAPAQTCPSRATSRTSRAARSPSPRAGRRPHQLHPRRRPAWSFKEIIRRARSGRPDLHLREGRQ